MTRATFGRKIFRTFGLTLVAVSLVTSTTLVAAMPQSIGFTTDESNAKAAVVLDAGNLRRPEVGLVECFPGECEADRTLAGIPANASTLTLVATRRGQLGLIACGSGECGVARSAGATTSASGGWRMGFTES